MRARRPLVLTAVMGLALALAGCAGDATADPTLTAGSSAPSAPTSGAGAVDVAGQSWTHVHNLAYDGQSLLLGTHQGLFQQQPGQQPNRLSDSPFDVMGLTHDGARWLASGHPGAGEDLPSDLGLRASSDGRLWATVSLLGEVDFHRLTAGGSTVVGISAHDSALLRSTDGGSTWTSLDNPGAFDVAVKPGDPATMLATTEGGPIVSTDGGASWSPVPGAPLIAVIAWTSSGSYGVAPDGTVHVSTDDGSTWQQRGSVGGQPAAVAAAGERVAVLVGGTVLESTDGATSFSPRLTGIDGH